MPRGDVETDGALIEQSVKGRPDAFVEVVQRHEAAVHGFLARRAGRQAADDLLGEVWVRAFAARGGYDLGTRRRAAVAVWDRPQRAASVTGGPGRTRAAVAEEAVDPWDDVVDRLDSAARAEPLAAALRALPGGGTRGLLLVAWEQLTPAEAAGVLGVPQGTVRSRLHRARAALRRVLTTRPGSAGGTT